MGNVGRESIAALLLFAGGADPFFQLIEVLGQGAASGVADLSHAELLVIVSDCAARIRAARVAGKPLGRELVPDHASHVGAAGQLLEPVKGRAPPWTRQVALPPGPPAKGEALCNLSDRKSTRLNSSH